MRYSMLVILAVGLSACDGDGAASFEGDLADADAALSASGGDELFDIAVSEAKEAYDVAELSIEVTPEGGDAIPVELELADDPDEDGKLGKGDTLRAIEPSTNVLDTASAGVTFTVVLTHTPADGDPVELFSGEWVPN